MRAALNDQVNQDKGFIRMQNQVESVGTKLPSSGHFRCKQCNFFPEQGKFLNFLSNIKHFTKLSKDLRFPQVSLISYSSFCTSSLSLIHFPVMNYKAPSLFNTLKVTF